MHFTKMNGLGNDYIFFDSMEKNIDIKKNTIKVLCNRNFGIGGDGIVIMQKSDKANFKMEIINPDGTYAEMCGNALRCVAKLFQKTYFPNKNHFRVETKAGIKDVFLNSNGTVTADMGKLIINMQPHTFYFPRKFEGYVVNAGNPHFVVETTDIESLSKFGKAISENNFFPARTNVEFASFDYKTNTAKIKIFERGVGETLACGTGAASVFEVGYKFSKLKDNATLFLPGGILYATHSKRGHVLITGNAEFNFEGNINI